MKEVRLEGITLNITDGKHGDCESEENSGYFFVSCKDVSDGSIHYENARQITERAYRETHKRTKLEPDDILITNSGTIGRMALIKDIPETYRTTFQKSVAIVKPNKDFVRPTYLYYCLLNCVNQFINQSNGSAQKNLLLRTMRNFKLNIEEDFSIQDKLSDVLSAYDDLIENNQKQIKLLEEAAQRLYKEWFVDLRFPGYEKVEIIDGVPEGWKPSTIGSVCKLRKESLKPDQIPSGLPYIGLEHIPRKDICLSTWGDSSNVNSSKYKYQEKDILFGKIRPYFHKVGFALNNGITSTDTIVVLPQEALWGYVLMTVSSEAFVNYTYQSCKEGAKMPRADWKQMQQYSILIPPSKIGNEFEKFLHIVTDRIKNLAFQNIRLTEARDRLLPKLMSSELEV